MADVICAVGETVVRRSDMGAQWLLHCAPEDAPAVARHTGLVLPEQCLTSAPAMGWHALHLSPDEWLLVGPRDVAERLVASFAGVPVPISLVDISDRSLGLEVAGELAIHLLGGACPLDLERLDEGLCTRTLLGKAMIMLWRRPSGWQVNYARSFDAYVTGLLAAIAADLASDLPSA